MNVMIFIAGVLAALATIGHFVVGIKAYLRPMKQSDIEIIPKGVMTCLFHYASVWLVLSLFALLWAGISPTGSSSLVQFIATVYIGMAIFQIIIAIKLPIGNGLFKLFQWIFWLLIALFAFAGTL